MPLALAVVAHFDDALLWAGGAIRRTGRQGWQWTIVCTCAAEAHRRRYFLASCCDLGVRGIALEFVDHPDGGPFSRNDPESMRSAIEAAVGDRGVDLMLTHRSDPPGEYGPHPNHTEAARAAAEVFDRNASAGSCLAEFRYRRAYASGAVSTVADPAASHFVMLDYDELHWKAVWALRARDVELGDPSLGGVSWLEKLAWPCPNPEAFAVRAGQLPPAFVRRDDA